MTIVLEDYQFELDGVVFGLHQKVAVDAEGFDSGSNEHATQDSDNPLSDGGQGGVDFVRAGSWTWAGFLDGESPEDALTALGVFSAAWANEEGRIISQDMRRLRYAVAGRTRCIYGRPRRLAAPLSNKIILGTSSVTFDFKKFDPLHYDDVEQAEALSTQPAAGSGFLAPFLAPLSTVGEVSASTVLEIGGDAKTAPIIEFKGPGLNHTVTIGGMKIELIGQLYAGDVVLIDCRPWKMSMTLNGYPVTSDKLRLSRKTRLSKVRLSPGAAQASFSVTDITGAARCTVRWRNAWHSI
jgi:hypothetical protein